MNLLITILDLGHKSRHTPPSKSPAHPIFKDFCLFYHLGQTSTPHKIPSQPITWLPIFSHLKNHSLPNSVFNFSLLLQYLLKTNTYTHSHSPLKLCNRINIYTPTPTPFKNSVTFFKNKGIYIHIL